MAKQIRVGIVGTSWWADLMFLPSLQNHPQAQIAAICGRNGERAAEMATKYAIPQVFTDYNALIAQGGLDALIVATPDDLHYPITMAALDAGLHVLCEKPMALNAQDARAMYGKANDVGVKHMVLFTWRLLPHARYVQQLIAEGYIGRCTQASFHFLAGFSRRPAYEWRLDRRRANGVLGDFGSHMIDLARSYVGEIARVGAQLNTYIERPGVDGQPLEPANDAAQLSIEFANGAQGLIQVSAVAHLGERAMEQRIMLHGEAGTLEVTVHFLGANSGVTIRGIRHDEAQFHEFPVPAHLWGEVEPTKPFIDNMFEFFAKQSVGARHFIDGIVNDLPVAPNFYDGLKVQEIIDAALESNNSGRWVSVPTSVPMKSGQT